MSYIKRDWDNTSNDVTKEDFKRIENGVEANDIKINVLNVDRGYLTSKYLNTIGIDLDTVIDNGIYSYNSWTNYLHAPSSSYGAIIGNMIVLKESNGGVTQIIISNYANSIILLRRKDNNGVWQPWTQIATTEKTTITFLNGWTKVPNFKCEITKSGKILSVNALISNSAPNTLPIFNIGTSISEGVIKFAQNNEKQNVEIRVAVNGDVSFYTTPTQSAWYTLDFSINL